MIVIFFNLYLEEKVLQIFTLRIVSPIPATLIAALHLTSLLDTVSHLDLKMSEVKISSKHARSSKFCAVWLFHRTKHEASSS